MCYRQYMVHAWQSLAGYSQEMQEIGATISETCHVIESAICVKMSFHWETFFVSIKLLDDSCPTAENLLVLLGGRSWSCQHLLGFRFSSYVDLHQNVLLLWSDFFSRIYILPWVGGRSSSIQAREITEKLIVNMTLALSRDCGGCEEDWSLIIHNLLLESYM